MNEKLKNNYPKICLVIFLIVWLILAIDPKYRSTWLLENALSIFFVIILIFTYKKFKLSNTSYTLITLYLIMHTIGAYTSYTEAPIGEYLKQIFGWERNNYDRIVHFSFGLLLAFPIREVFLRVAKVKGFWGYYLPFDVTASFSALYEVIEWITVAVRPTTSISFLGMQGDIWDAQKDIGLAVLGALITMIITALVNIKTRKSELK